MHNRVAKRIKGEQHPVCCAVMPITPDRHQFLKAAHAAMDDQFYPIKNGDQFYDLYRLPLSHWSN